MSEIIDIMIGHQPTSLAEVQQLCEQMKDLRDERDRLRRALEQVSFHLAQPGDDETPANQYVPTAAEIVTCQRIIDAALTPAGQRLTPNEATE